MRMPKEGIIQILSLDGQLIEEITPRTKQIQIDLSDLQPSVYFIRFCNNQTVKVEKIFKN